jgi:hypothetical protein
MAAANHPLSDSDPVVWSTPAIPQSKTPVPAKTFQSKNTAPIRTDRDKGGMWIFLEKDP